jgi:predicted RNase H-like nuclease
MRSRDPIFLTGVDGCKDGWIAVFHPKGARAKAEAKVFRDLASLVDERSIGTIAIDMPMGLPGSGGRAAETQVRAQIGPRRSSVFSIPARAAVAAYAEGYAKVCEIARQHSLPSRAPSKQAYHIFPRILEVDAALRRTAGLAARLFEVHPELAFRIMNEAPLLHPKKQKGRLCEAGMDLRRGLLLAQGYCAEFLDQTPPRGARRDDFYDACAAAWSAARIADGEASVFPAEPVFDETGLPMRIWG